MSESIPYLRAQLEAARASLDARALTIVQQQRELDAALAELRALQDREAALRAAENSITDRAALLRFAAAQNKAGVPCYVMGNFVFHRLTRAILAQVTA